MKRINLHLLITIILLSCILISSNQTLAQTGSLEDGKKSTKNDRKTQTFFDHGEDHFTHIIKRKKGSSLQTVVVPLPRGKEILARDGNRQPRGYNKQEQQIARGVRELMKMNKSIGQREAVKLVQERLEQNSLHQTIRRKEKERIKRKLNPVKDRRKTNGPRSYENEKARRITSLLKKKDNGINNHEDAAKVADQQIEEKKRKDREGKRLARKRQREAAG